jgi:hypothetical protein
MKRILLFFVLLFCILPVLSNSLEAGAVFLMIFPGSRATSMGGAFGAIEGDVFSTYYNNAALAFSDKKVLGLQHANWLPGLYKGMYYEYLAFVLPVGKDMNVSGAVTYLTTGLTEASFEGIYREWLTYDVAFKLAGSMPISDKMGVSLGMKYIYSFLAPEEIVEELGRQYGGTMRGGTGHAWALDGSIFYRWTDLASIEALGMEWLNVLRLGLAFQNFGTEIRYIEGGNSDPLPRTVRASFSLSLLENKEHQLRVNLDLIKIAVRIEKYTDFREMWEDTWKACGLEYIFNELFSLRFGYFIDELGKRKGPTFGAGFQYKTFYFDLSVDQEIYDFETSNYRLSAQYSF